MDPLFGQIANLLTVPPGNLVYDLILLFAVSATFQFFLMNRKGSAFPHLARTLFGLSILLFALAFLFVADGLAWQELIRSNTFLPSFDRAVFTLCLVWVGWLWIFPNPSRPADILLGVLTLAISGGFLLSGLSWTVSGALVPFNFSIQDLAWAIAGIALCALALLLLVIRRPAGWGFGLGSFILWLAGLAAHLAFPLEGDFSTAERLAMLAVFSLLPTLTARIQPSLPAAVPANTPRPERRRYSADPRTVQAWLMVNIHDEPQLFPSSVARAVGQTMLSDFCFLVAPAVSSNSLAFPAGYDLIREDSYDTLLFTRSQLPSLARALERGQAMRLVAGESNALDLETLARALNLKEAGSLLFVPFPNPPASFAGVALLSPYSMRTWTVEDQNYLTAIAGGIAQVIRSRMTPAAQTTSQMKELRDQVSALKNENEMLREEKQTLQDQLPTLSPHQSPPAILADLEALATVYQETQESLQSLKIENERLRASLNGGNANSERLQKLEVDLRESLDEISRLQHVLDGTQNGSFEDSSGLNPESLEMVASLARELRQPLSSVIGYTDLLLSESVGILGALQRKLLERIKSSNERLRSLLDVLLRLATMHKEVPADTESDYDLITLLDSTLQEVSTPLREKNQVLDLDLPARAISMRLQADALQQALVHLLLNASAVSPAGSKIDLKVEYQPGPDDDYLMIHVTDYGGGIDPENLSRVFNRRYRNSNPVISGVGDNGVGLAIAQTLVNSLAGRIWAKSSPGNPTTFSILLPLNIPQVV